MLNRKRDSQVHSFSSQSRKKGVSPVIGYILLISIIISLSIIVFQWIKTYVPTEQLECPDGASVFLKDVNYTCNGGTLNLSIKNNGRFDLAGYFIHAGNIQGSDIATQDLSGYLSPPGIGDGKVIFAQNENAFTAGQERPINNFDFIGENLVSLFFLEIIPVRYEKINERNRLASCTDARIVEKLECEPISTCGNPSFPGCDSGETCSNCPSDCGICPTTYCGDGEIDSPNQEFPEIFEQCDDENEIDGDGCGATGANACLIENGWQCSGEPSSQCNVIVYQLGYAGFETGKDGWSTSDLPSGDQDSNRITTLSKVDDNGQNGGTASLHIQDDDPSNSIISRVFDLSPYKNITISWWGNYNSFEKDECIELKIGGVKVHSWGEKDGGGTICGQDITDDGTWVSNTTKIVDDQYVDFGTGSIEIRFEGKMNANDDDFYIDGINITATKV